jgi:hypothetical protein
MYSFTVDVSIDSVIINYVKGSEPEFKLIMQTLTDFNENDQGSYYYSDKWGYGGKDTLETAHKAVIILNDFGWTRVFPEADSSGTAVRD